MLRRIASKWYFGLFFMLLTGSNSKAYEEHFARRAASPGTPNEYESAIWTFLESLYLMSQAVDKLGTLIWWTIWLLCAVNIGFWLKDKRRRDLCRNTYSRLPRGPVGESRFAFPRRKLRGTSKWVDWWVLSVPLSLLALGLITALAGLDIGLESEAVERIGRRLSVIAIYLIPVFILITLSLLAIRWWLHLRQNNHTQPVEDRRALLKLGWKGRTDRNHD